LPDRINALDTQAKSRDWNQLAQTAHQIKGAAGSYGFDEITPYAARLEAFALEARQEDQILSSLDDLRCLCLRVRSGMPQADKATADTTVSDHQFLRPIRNGRKHGIHDDQTTELRENHQEGGRVGMSHGRPPSGGDP
jgi:histidine phosphotransfer protein HptB